MTKTEINRPFRSGFLSYLCPFSLAWSLGWWMGLIGLCGDRVLGSSDPSYTHLVQWVGPPPPEAQCEESSCSAGDQGVIPG